MHYLHSLFAPGALDLPDSGLCHGFASHQVEPAIFATVLKPKCLRHCVFSSMLTISFQAWPVRRVFSLKVPRFQAHRMANGQYFRVADSKTRMLRLLSSFWCLGATDELRIPSMHRRCVSRADLSWNLFCPEPKSVIYHIKCLSRVLNQTGQVILARNALVSSKLSVQLGSGVFDSHVV